MGSPPDPSDQTSEPSSAGPGPDESEGAGTASASPEPGLDQAGPPDTSARLEPDVNEGATPALPDEQANRVSDANDPLGPHEARAIDAPGAHDPSGSPEVQAINAPDAHAPSEPPEAQAVEGLDAEDPAEPPTDDGEGAAWLPYAVLAVLVLLGLASFVSTLLR
jgi:hypothetical protein